MLSYLFSKNPNKYWLHTLILLAILLFAILWYKRQILPSVYEGFSQDAPFVFKTGSDVYDDFYVEIYDKLFLPDKTCGDLVKKVVEMTQPTKSNSGFLVLGSGTGHCLGQLQKLGYHAYGMDESKAMVDYSERIFPDIQVKCGDANESMFYENGTFTHVLCNGMTIYQFQDKRRILQNCFQWLRPGGYLTIQLVDPAKFDTIVPGGKPPLLKSPQAHAKRRITDTVIDFIDFEYKGQYSFPEQGVAIFKETFTDGLSKKVRQNQTVLYVDSVDVILNIAKDIGFLVKGMVNLEECSGDKYQYLYILERSHKTIGYMM